MCPKLLNQNNYPSRGAGLVEGLELGRQEGEQVGLIKGREEGEQIGIAKGRAEGEQQALLKLLQGMQAQGLRVSMIASIAGLSKTEVEHLLSTNADKDIPELIEILGHKTA